ncbi:cytochrome P450 4F12-like [Sycon ciliatum]|uniref:cytochrome P450 4F12-like n=1 Tax=Sycon ciliatum TaxID=27933 RepID=UPI0031F68F49
MVGWVFLALCTLFVLLTPRLWAFVRFKWMIRSVPVPEPAHFLLGHVKVLSNRSKILERRRKWRSKCPRLYRYGISYLMDIVQLCHADTAAEVLRSSLPKHDYIYGFLKPWLGEGLLVSNGQKWARDRRLLTHCFHFDILRDYVEVYTDACGIMLQKWSESCVKGESVDVTASCTLLTLDVMLRCAMGFESNCQLEEEGSDQEEAPKYAATVTELTNKLMDRIFHIMKHNDFLYFNSADGKEFTRCLELVHSVSQKLIERRRAALQEEDSHSQVHKHQYRDFLDVLLTVKDEDGKGLTDTEIREQVDTFLFRGHDTTASALQWIIHHLSVHADLQEKCREEVQGLLSSGPATLKHGDLQQMIYTTQFIKESLRFSCPVPAVARAATEDITMDGCTIPRGSHIEVSMYDVHTHPEYWPEPQQFNPDRFSAEQSVGRNSFAFIPFSAGPRNCIGQAMAMDELKAAVACILYSYRIAPDPANPTPIWTSSVVARAIPRISVTLHAL